MWITFILSFNFICEHPCDLSASSYRQTSRISPLAFPSSQARASLQRERRHEITTCSPYKSNIQFGLPSQQASQILNSKICPGEKRYFSQRDEVVHPNTAYSPGDQGIHTLLFVQEVQLDPKTNTTQHINGLDLSVSLKIDTNTIKYI